MISKARHVFFTLLCLTLLTACALKPQTWLPQDSPPLTGAYALNDSLQKTQWIDLKGWYGPEDIAVDAQGNLYCGVHDSKYKFTKGRILKIDTSGNMTTFCHTGGWVTGLHFDKNQHLIACDQKRGLISINRLGQITLLASHDENNQPFLLPNDVDIANDGMIYFTNTSSHVRFSRKHARKILFEAKPDGGLYAYSPINNTVTTLIDSSYFGNGVAVSQHGDFVLMVDLTKYRVLRYWLKGDKKGTTEIFLDNLPGLPNGISRREDGSFWLGFTTKRDPLLDKIQPKKGVKKLIYAIPLWLQPKQRAFGMIMNISEKGQVLQTYYDPTGKVVSEASSIEEHNGVLYIGGDLPDHIGKYVLH